MHKVKNKSRKWKNDEDQRFNDGMNNVKKRNAQVDHRSRNNERQDLRRAVFG